MKEFSITEVRNRLSRFVRRVEQNEPIKITREGRPIAVLMSLREFERLQSRPREFFDAYQAFRARVNIEELSVTGEEFSGLRDPLPGKES